ncbi:hypothetical protein C8J56DRAFT_482559 [Mycena floridula]|nr:hypothetical protein C8J56DRAFT_482559 [Mycena floridula]
MFLTRVLSLFIAAAAVSASQHSRFSARAISVNPILEKRAGKSFNPPTSVLQRSDETTEVVGRDEPLTNAKRLSLGLPLMAPTRRQTARTSRPSGKAPYVKKGHLKAYDSKNHLVGYVAASLNEFGEYIFTQHSSQSLKVEVHEDSEGTMIALNPPNPAYPLVGGITGFASTDNNIGPDSFNYGYFGGVKSSPHGKPSNVGNTFTTATSIQESSESVMWKLNSNGHVTAHWTNVDGSRPHTYLLNTKGILAFTGDLKSFRDAFGPATHIILKFVHDP